MSLRTSTTKNGIIEYFVDGAPDWDHFDSIIKFLEKYYSANVLERQDGIFTRIYKLEIGELKFFLKHHEDIGNYFYSEANQKQDQLIMISKDLSKRLS